jgi:4-hydroxy-2-oxoheptanedioate aldolase
MVSQYPIFQKWSSGKTAINIFLKIPNAWTAEMISNLGFDAVTFDLQHGPIDFRDMVNMLLALNKSTYPMARLSVNNAAETMRVLDAGVKGVICPMIDSRAEAESFVSACYYPPRGLRSYGPWRANAPSRSTYMKDYHEDIRLFAQIETKSGLMNVDDIAATPGLSGLYLGPYDLSIDLGYEKMSDFSDPTFMVQVKKVLDAAHKNKLLAAVQAYNEDDAAMLAKMGFNIVTPVDESAEMMRAVREKLERVKGKIGN